MKKTTNKQMLNWVGRFVCSIETLNKPAKGKPRVVRVTWVGGVDPNDSHEQMITTRKGRNLKEAFRRCVQGAMREQREMKKK